MGFASRCLLLLAVAGALACARKETRRVLVTTAASTPRAVTSAQGAPASVPAPGDSANSPPAVPPLEAELHLPKTAPGERSPLFLFLHGFGASAETIIENTDWVEFAERSRIAWMAPDGPKDRQGRRFWNAGDSCCNLGREPVDHVRALGALIERSLATGAIDAARVFVVGFSNGGFMAHRLGCEIPELVRGIVSLAGSGPLQTATCANGPPLRVLQIHGDADDIVFFEGGHLFGRQGYPEHASAQKTVDDWAARLGCAAAPQTPPSFDFEADLPGRETRVQRFSGCARGRVELWRVTGGSHYVGFRAPSQAAVWRFLNE